MLLQRCWYFSMLISNAMYSNVVGISAVSKISGRINGLKVLLVTLLITSIFSIRYFMHTSTHLRIFRNVLMVQTIHTFFNPLNTLSTPGSAPIFRTIQNLRALPLVEH